MNKKIGLLLSLALLVGCSSGTKTQEVKKEKKSEKTSETATIANPFEDCDSLEDAAGIAGFELVCPESILDSDSKEIQAVKDNMIQVIYTKDGNEVLRIRKSNSTEDITGDYNEYSEEVDQDVNGVNVHCKGENGKYSTISWSLNDDQYCILGNNLSLEDITSIVNSIR